MTPRGYCGIGIYGSKTAANVGTLWRSAAIYGASFIFTIGHRYPHQATDTLKAWKHVPLWQFDTVEELSDFGPVGCTLIAIEQTAHSRPLDKLVHPERAIYLLGAEDGGLPRDVLRVCSQIVEIPTPNPYCMNVATAGSIVLHDRWTRS